MEAILQILLIEIGTKILDMCCIVSSQAITPPDVEFQLEFIQFTELKNG
jgi:hypothetical protein